MPELPEVQTIVNTLSTSKLLNKKIIGVKVYTPKLLKNANPHSFIKFLLNESINKIERIGKYLIFRLSHRKILTIHLRMEGKLFNEPIISSLQPKHLRVEFILNNKRVLRYYDSRMFGTFHIYVNNKHLQAEHIKKIAFDPLNSKFNWKYLKSHIHTSHRAIKTAILDQTNVSGIGNIYADEILFASKIHPAKKACALTDSQYKSIAKYAKILLLKAIKHGGTTIATYQSDINHSGAFQKMLKVHMRKNMPCYVCKTPIIKTQINGRGTYFCPHCQKM